MTTHRVRVTTHGDGERTMLYVLGWGDRPTHEPESWVFDELAARGWTTHAVTLPENGTAFGRAYIDPVASIRADVRPDVVVGQSLGGLVVAHLPGDRPRVYTSPFWGFPDGPLSPVVPLLARLPVTARVLPVGSDPTAIGPLKPASESSAGDRGASPAWLAAVNGAHRRLPRFREGSVVHCSPTDSVVSVRAIGDHAPAERVRLYDGGHEFFASRDRKAILDRVVADCRAIADGEVPPATGVCDDGV